MVFKKWFPSHLVLVGDGPEKAKAQDLVFFTQFRRQCDIFGELMTNVQTIYSGSDLFLLPSEHESFGLSALEALAAGCPVVATSKKWCRRVCYFRA